MTEREHERRYQRAKGDDSFDDLGPGRGTPSAQLRTPREPIASGLIQRKAERDGNGVAGDAATAVDTAASSSGAPLPETLQRKFESSLGTDLSSVRVHTGGASETAAHAVGAQAYTVGQDIHFGAGKFDPSSSAGEHLLAHEVAHTVQQRGGSGGPQFKLEVSTPHDAAEHEADRAADAMIVGERAAVSSTGSGRAFRDALANEMSSAADKAEQGGIAAAAASGVPNATTIGSVDEAKATVAAIDAATPELQSAVSEGAGTSDNLTANVTARTTVNSYIDDLTVQQRHVDAFINQFVKYSADYQRINADAKTLTASAQAATGEAPRATSFAEQGEQLVQIGSGMSSGEAQGTLNKLMKSNPELARAADTTSKSKDKLDASVGQLPKLQRDLETVEGRYLSEVGRAGAISTKYKIKGLEAELADLNRRSGAVKDGVKSTLSGVKLGNSSIKAAQEAQKAYEIASDAVKAAGWSVKLISPASWAGLAADLLGLLDSLSKKSLSKEIKDKEAEIEMRQQQELAQEAQATARAIRTEEKALTNAVNDYNEKCAEIEKEKMTYRAAMTNLGNMADQSNSEEGTRFSAIARLLADGDNFLSQSTLTIQAAKQEMSLAQDAKATLGNANKLTWYRAVRDRSSGVATTGQIGFSIYSQQLSLTGSAWQGVESSRGANPIIAKALPELEQMHANMTEILKPVRNAMGQ
jgi:hypothetical protein